ncbi:MAG TPA: FAD-dependent oxidoreductase [Kofleriaceae bacterium]|nr:FAD-dependent oxidoreductase [Kofleriaceae bacterium]
MDRPIGRRDFLQGMAAGLAVAALPGCTHAGGPSPAPALRRPGYGLRGQNMASMDLGHIVRSGSDSDAPGTEDTGEEYDLVVVGAGIAGLATAYVYDRERGGRSRILVLDNNDEFGGHARRNTFEVDGQTLIAHGGTYALEEVEEAPPAAQALLSDVGVDVARLRAYRDERIYPQLGLSRAIFFDPRHYPGIEPTWVDKFYDTRYEAFFAKAPIPEAARRELVKLYTTRRNYLPGVADKEGALAGMSWEHFIREVMGLGDQALRFADLYAADLVGLGCDAISALKGFWYGPGFFGMGGTGFREKDGIIQYAYDASYRYPDGNHTVARHFLKKLLPGSIEGEDTMEGVFNGQIRTDRFDLADNQKRLRLRAAAVRVAHEGPSHATAVTVDYVQPDGRTRRVRARGAVVAAWGMVAKRIVPELGAAQLEALEQYHYCACLYINVVLRHWRPIAEIGAFSMQLPGGYCTWMEIADPLSVGSYRPSYGPDNPTVLSMYKYLYTRGLPPVEQMRKARREIEHKTFAEHEREIRSELRLLFGPWGFDPAKDILAITVNRWGHAYNFFPPTADHAAPYELGRQALGRISFAGADAGGIPWTMAALDQGNRAALEQLRLT